MKRYRRYIIQNVMSAIVMLGCAAFQFWMHNMIGIIFGGVFVLIAGVFVSLIIQWERLDRRQDQIDAMTDMIEKEIANYEHALRPAGDLLDHARRSDF